MKFLKTTGLLLFLTGFLIFNVSFFWARYTLTPEIVTSQISDPRKAGLLIQETSGMMDKQTGSNFNFVSELTQAFDRVNEKQLETFAISGEETERLTAANGQKFSISSIDSIFKGDDEINAFKRKTFHDYGNWLDGKQFAGSEESKTVIQGVADNIRNYGIVGALGFDRYAIKDLKYSLTKASADSPVKNNPGLFLFLSIGLCVGGALLYIFPKLQLQSGVKNNGCAF